MASHWRAILGLGERLLGENGWWSETAEPAACLGTCPRRRAVGPRELSGRGLLAEQGAGPSRPRCRCLAGPAGGNVSLSVRLCSSCPPPLAPGAASPPRPLFSHHASPLPLPPQAPMAHRRPLAPLCRSPAPLLPPSSGYVCRLAVLSQPVEKGPQS